ncbi:MAG: hypothetical protein FWF85_02530 [Clostridiales bacterium]|nr:hypothetical protein [Clostridiales bacterium]
MNQQELQAIRERYEAATPGEWVIPPSFSGITSRSGDVLFGWPWNANTINDFRYIVATRQDIPALLEYAEALEHALKQADFDCCFCNYNDGDFEKDPCGDCKDNKYYEFNFGPKETTK